MHNLQYVHFFDSMCLKIASVLLEIIVHFLCKAVFCGKHMKGAAKCVKFG